MKTLTHNTCVKMEGKQAFRYGARVTVGTVEGYAIENRENPAEAVARTLERKRKYPYEGHELAWTNAGAAVLMADGPAKDAYYVKLKADLENAVELVDGETVSIENRLYTVQYMGDYADPVHFVPVKG